MSTREASARAGDASEPDPWVTGTPAKGESGRALPRYSAQDQINDSPSLSANDAEYESRTLGEGGAPNGSSSSENGLQDVEARIREAELKGLKGSKDVERGATPNLGLLANHDEAAYSSTEMDWYDRRETVKVSLSSEKEGTIFKHNIYIVESRQRASAVSRRYSDWDWLKMVLISRYPFRAIPALPPKQASPGAHLAATNESLETRAKGLQRWINLVVNHPILREDAIVIKFLTEPSDLTTWRKGTSISLVEESKLAAERPISSADIDSIPTGQGLNEAIREMGSRLKIDLDSYRTFAGALERISRRREGIAAEWTRMSGALNDIISGDEQCKRLDVGKKQDVEADLLAVVDHLDTEAKTAVDRAENTTTYLLETVRLYRDFLAALSMALDRLERLGGDTLPKIKSTIQAHHTKYQTLLHAQEPLPKNHKEQLEKLSSSIQSDLRELEIQARRKAHIRLVVWHEMVLLQRRMTIIQTNLWKQLTSEEIEFAKDTLSNFQSLDAKLT